MAEILASIRYNLARLLLFSGRETRGQFWPYAISLFIVQLAVGMLLLIPVMFDMFARLQRYLIEHPEGLPTETGPYPGAVVLPPELMPDMAIVTVPAAVLNLLFVLLLAAAVVRRLHDRDKSGWWALMPVPFMVYGQIKGPEAATMMMSGAMARSPEMLLVMLSNLLYWIALIVLVVILAQTGTDGPNSYGPEPQEVR
jgi:uncharacterized membrane protein YhaH (DUF805 family)